MKNLLIGLFFLGFTGLIHSQITPTANEIKLEPVTITPLNISYLNAVKDDNTPASVLSLENKVANFDITEQQIYSNNNIGSVLSNNFEAYEVVFEETNDPVGCKGRIIATYDSEGKVLSTLERFKNVSLPSEVRNAVYKAYPDWLIEKDLYSVSYYTGDEIKKMYKVRIKKDNQRKNLKIGTKGQFL